MSDDLEQRAEARVGRTLNDKWRLERLLGVGGMAAVYAARHRNGAKAALKLLHPELAADANVRERFVHEGKAANLVEHPNAVQVMDDDVVREGSPGDEGAAYLVMELLNGESLLDYARRVGRNLREEEVLEIADGVLEVLEAAHAHGIVHRDLKPENLFLVKPASPHSGVGLSAMLKEWTHVKVLDFGIARIADGGGKTRVGTTLGTPTYMAPEQAQGRRDAIDGRTDLFALGATMWRLLTGTRVHEGPSTAEILAKMATVPAAPIRSVAPQLSEPVARIVDRAVKFRREERYPDAHTMREDVRAAREGRPLPFVEPVIVEERTAVEGPGARKQAAARPASFAAAVGDPTPAPPAAPMTMPLAPVAPTPTVQASPAAATVIPYTDRAVAPVAAMAVTPAEPRKTSRAWFLLLAVIPIGAAVAFFALRGGAPAPAAAGAESPSTSDDDKKASTKKSADDDDDDDDSSAKHTTAATAAATDDQAPSATTDDGNDDSLHGVAPGSTATKKKPTTTTSTTAQKKPSGAGPAAIAATVDGKPTSTAPIVNIVPPSTATTTATPTTTPNDPKKGPNGVGNNGKKKGK